MTAPNDCQPPTSAAASASASKEEAPSVQQQQQQQQQKQTPPPPRSRRRHRHHHRAAPTPPAPAAAAAAASSSLRTLFQTASLLLHTTLSPNIKKPNHPCALKVLREAMRLTEGWIERCEKVEREVEVQAKRRLGRRGGGGLEGEDGKERGDDDEKGCGSRKCGESGKASSDVEGAVLTMGGKELNGCEKSSCGKRRRKNGKRKEGFVDVVEGLTREKLVAFIKEILNCKRNRYESPRRLGLLRGLRQRLEREVVVAKGEIQRLEGVLSEVGDVGKRQRKKGRMRKDGGVAGHDVVQGGHDVVEGRQDEVETAEASPESGVGHGGKEPLLRPAHEKKSKGRTQAASSTWRGQAVASSQASKATAVTRVREADLQQDPVMSAALLLHEGRDAGNTAADETRSGSTKTAHLPASTGPHTREVSRDDRAPESVQERDHHIERGSVSRSSSAYTRITRPPTLSSAGDGGLTIRSGKRSVVAGQMLSKPLRTQSGKSTQASSRNEEKSPLSSDQKRSHPEPKFSIPPSGKPNKVPNLREEVAMSPETVSKASSRHGSDKHKATGGRHSTATTTRSSRAPSKYSGSHDRGGGAEGELTAATSRSASKVSSGQRPDQEESSTNTVSVARSDKSFKVVSKDPMGGCVSPNHGPSIGKMLATNSNEGHTTVSSKESSKGSPRHAALQPLIADITEGTEPPESEANLGHASGEASASSSRTPSKLWHESLASIKKQTEVAMQESKASEAKGHETASTGKVSSSSKASKASGARGHETASTGKVSSSSKASKSSEAGDRDETASTGKEYSSSKASKSSPGIAAAIERGDVGASESTEMRPAPGSTQSSRINSGRAVRVSTGREDCRLQAATPSHKSKSSSRDSARSGTLVGVVSAGHSATQDGKSLSESIASHASVSSASSSMLAETSSSVVGQVAVSSHASSKSSTGAMRVEECR